MRRLSIPTCLVLMLGFAVALPMAAASAAPAAAAVVAPLKTEDDVAAYADRAMKAVGRGDLDAVYGIFLEHSVLPANELTDGLQASRQQRAAPAYVSRFGSSIGYEFIDAARAGTSLIRLRYIEKTQKQPLVWTLAFYRGADGWVLSGFGWSPDGSTLFATH